MSVQSIESLNYKSFSGINSAISGQPKGLKKWTKLPQPDKKNEINLMGGKSVTLF